jgi:hypothetical protein
MACCVVITLVSIASGDGSADRLRIYTLGQCDAARILYFEMNAIGPDPLSTPGGGPAAEIATYGWGYIGDRH